MNSWIPRRKKMLIIRQLRINIQCACRYATQKKYKYRITKIDKSKFSRNPGIQNQLQLFSKNNSDIENMKPEDMNPEALEADFMKAEDMVDDYDRTLAKALAKHDFKKIEQKYFKSSPTPNMLTWAEKEQIRYLHNDNPSHWTPEKLAASFPALPDVIKKILKSSWKPQSANRIIEHDKKVATNWNDFVQGQLQIESSEIKEHLAKFTSRQNNISSFSKPDLKQIINNSTPKPASSEFSSIISSYKQETSKELTSPAAIDYTIENKQLIKHSDKYGIRDKNQYSLESFKEKIQNEVDSRKVNPDDNILLLSEKKRNLVSNHYVVSSERYDCDAVVTNKGKLGQITHFNEEDYPKRIFIPKNKRKYGALNKVNDCYYTSDGLFLYRVPGLNQEI